MSSQLFELWEKTLELIKKEIASVSFSLWFKNTMPVKLSEGVLYIGAPDELNKNMLQSKYMNLIQNAVGEVSGISYEIAIVIGDEATEAPIAPAPAAGAPGAGSFLNPRYTFDNYVVGNSNRYAHAASVAVAERPAFAYNPLFLWGGVGLGKTHLMHAIGNFVVENAPEKKVLFVSAETFTNELINSIKDSKNEEFRNKYRSIDVLLIDDIQFIAGKSSTEEEFFHTFNTLHEANKQIVLTSDRPPKEIANLTERLRSRFEWGLICDVNPPDYETRIAILKKKAQDDNIYVSDEVFMFIAEKIKSNIRELEGVFNSVVAYRGLVNKEISIEVAEEALKNYNTNRSPEALTPKEIISATAKYFRLKPEDMKSQRRTKELAAARQIAMYLCRELTGVSLKKLGEEYFGNRDHTTIMHGIKKVEQDLGQNPDVKNAVETLMRDLRNE